MNRDLAFAHKVPLPATLTPRERADDLGFVLVVSTDRAGGRRLGSAVERRVPSVYAQSPAEARAVVETKSCIAVVLELPGRGRGAEASLAAEARAAVGELPMLVVSHNADRMLPEHVRLAGASYFAGTTIDDDVEGFVERVVIALRGEEAWMEAAVAWLGEHWRLTKREREIVLLLARGTPRTELAALLGSAAGTVRTQLSSVLRKSGLPDAAAVGRHVRGHARTTFSRM